MYGVGRGGSTRCVGWAEGVPLDVWGGQRGFH